MAIILDLFIDPGLRHPEKAHKPDLWVCSEAGLDFGVKAPVSPGLSLVTHKKMRDNGLHTVCEEAGCPNIGECWV